MQSKRKNEPVWRFNTTFSQHLPFLMSADWDVCVIQLRNKVLGFEVWGLKKSEDSEREVTKSICYGVIDEINTLNYQSIEKQ